GIVHQGVRPGKYALLGAYPDEIAGRRPSTRGSHPAGAGRREHRARVRRGDPTASKERTMREVLVDFITTLDGYASGEGWPGFWGLEGPEYLAWLSSQPEVSYLMGANTYRLMSGFAAGEVPPGQEEFSEEEAGSLDQLTKAPKYVFSNTLEEPLAWANSTLVRGDAVEAVRAMKAEGEGIFGTLGSLTLARSLCVGGVADGFRAVMAPVAAGATGGGRIYDGCPGVALEMTDDAWPAGSTATGRPPRCSPSSTSPTPTAPRPPSAPTGPGG